MAILSFLHIMEAARAPDLFLVTNSSRDTWIIKSWNVGHKRCFEAIRNGSKSNTVLQAFHHLYIIIIYPLDFFTSALPDGFLLELEWHQVSSSL